MKKSFFLIAATALTLGLANCSREKVDVNGNIDEGKPTYMGISFTIPSTGNVGTRSDANANDAETAFKFVDVFIYNTSTGTQTNHARIPASEFTGPVSGSNTDEWIAKTTAKIATTTGEKTIIVGVNLSSSLSSSLSGVSMGTFTTIVQSVDIADVTGSTDGFAMFSTAPKVVTLVVDASLNNPKVQVQRLVAKVTVQKKDGIAITGGGIIDNLMFVLNNTNKKTFYVQPSDKKDHNWAVTPAGDLANGNTDYVLVNEHTVAVKDLTPKYCLENTTRDFLMGQITRVTVRATFIPASIKAFVNGTDNTEGYKDEAVSATTPATFYSVLYNGGADKAYFFDINAATAFAGEKGVSVMTYNNGYCYWDMFLNPDNIVSTPYDVLRNDFYRCNITKIIAPGRSTPDVTDPDIPPMQATDLMVDIEVVYWNPIHNDYELAP